MIKQVLHILLFLALMYGIGFGVYITTILTWPIPQDDTDGLVALTGGDMRVKTAIDLLTQQHAQRLLISGADQHLTQKQLLKLYHVDAQWADKIDLGLQAIDTIGNADETAAWATKHGLHNIMVVTANYHVPRSMIHFINRLPDVTLTFYPVTPTLFSAPQWYLHGAPWRLLCVEYNKLLLTYPQIWLRAARA